VLSFTTLSGNTTQSNDGGALHNTGDALVTNSLFSGNLATAQGGRDGGGIYNAGTLTVLRSRFNGNAGVREGGWPRDGLTRSPQTAPE
jgi:hypothetical protein